MSMIGEYLRVTPAELERAVEDPDWALEFAEQVQDTEEEAKPSASEARYFSTYKCWDMLGFLFRRAGFRPGSHLAEARCRRSWIAQLRLNW